jgi:hypothetical protein
MEGIRGQMVSRAIWKGYINIGSYINTEMNSIEAGFFKKISVFS